MIAAGASANFTKIAEVDKANTPKNKMQYERIGDFKVCPRQIVYYNKLNMIKCTKVSI